MWRLLRGERSGCNARGARRPGEELSRASGRDTGIDPHRAPEAAEDFVASRPPPPERSGRANRLTRDEFRQWRRRRWEEEE